MPGCRRPSRIVIRHFSTGAVFVYFAERIRRSAVTRVSGVTGAWAERRTPGIQRIAPPASQTTGRPHRSSRGTFRSIRISFTFFSPPRALPPAPAPNGRIRSPARKGRTVSGNARPAASKASASPFAASRFACAGVILPLSSRDEFDAGRRSDRSARRAPLRTGWRVSTPSPRSRARRAPRSRRSRPSP